MEIKQKLKINPDVVMNRGHNFLNIDKERYFGKKYRINVFVKVRMNLKTTEKELRVKTILPFYCYYRGESLEDFFKELSVYCKKPFFKIDEGTNRKDKVSTLNLEDKIREKNIIFNDIEITIGKLAKEELKQMGIDFEKKVKEILKLQKPTDEKKQKLIDRFVYLKEKHLTLKSFLEKKNRWGYSSEKKDKTLKIGVLITPQEYDEKLKEIEDEMKEIAKVFNFRVSEFEYLTKDKEEDNEDDYDEEDDDYYEDDEDEEYY